MKVLLSFIQNLIFYRITINIHIISYDFLWQSHLYFLVLGKL